MFDLAKKKCDLAIFFPNLDDLADFLYITNDLAEIFPSMLNTAFFLKTRVDINTDHNLLIQVKGPQKGGQNVLLCGDLVVGVYWKKWH